MPRIENLGDNVSAWHDAPGNGNGSSTWDVCRHCADELEYEPHTFDDKLVPYNDDPPGDAGRGGNCEHPPYEDGDYTCAVCNEPLIEEDD